MRRYVHVATGNYNPVTSNFYTDLGLFTADEEIGADATDLFNFLTGFSRQKEYRRLLVSPTALREQTLALIRREADPRPLSLSAPLQTALVVCAVAVIFIGVYPHPVIKMAEALVSTLAAGGALALR